MQNHSFDSRKNNYVYRVSLVDGTVTYINSLEELGSMLFDGIEFVDVFEPPKRGSKMINVCSFRTDDNDVDLKLLLDDIGVSEDTCVEVIDGISRVWDNLSNDIKYKLAYALVGGRLK